jgi:hypothetical protein
LAASQPLGSANSGDFHKSDENKMSPERFRGCIVWLGVHLGPLRRMRTNYRDFGPKQ